MLRRPVAELSRLRGSERLNHLTIDVDVLDGLALRLVIPAVAAIVDLRCRLCWCWHGSPRRSSPPGRSRASLSASLIAMLLTLRRTRRASRLGQRAMQALRMRFIDMMRGQSELVVTGRLEDWRRSVMDAHVRLQETQNEIDAADQQSVFVIAAFTTLAAAGALLLRRPCRACRTARCRRRGDRLLRRAGDVRGRRPACPRHRRTRPDDRRRPPDRAAARDAGRGVVVAGRARRCPMRRRSPSRASAYAVGGAHPLRRDSRSPSGQGRASRSPAPAAPARPRCSIWRAGSPPRDRGRSSSPDGRSSRGRRRSGRDSSATCRSAPRSSAAPLWITSSSPAPMRPTRCCGRRFTSPHSIRW